MTNQAINHDREFLAALREAPPITKILGEQKVAEIERRKEILAEIDQLDKKAAKELPPLLAVVDGILAEIRALERTIRQGVDLSTITAEKAEAIAVERLEAQGRHVIAVGKLGRARAKSLAASEDYRLQRDERVALLRKGADHAIALFKDEMLALFQATRRIKPYTQQLVATEKGFGGETLTKRTVVSTAASGARRMAAIRDAIRQADELALRADQRDMDVELERIRQALPSISSEEVS